jgi:uncharacterized protein (TIGR02996 family)
MARKATGTEAGFLQAILEAPDDDAPRLIFADWLDDNSRPEHARLIRVQCELARLPDDDPRRPELETEAERLLPEYNVGLRAQLAEGLPAWARDSSPRIERGFVSGLTLTPGRFVKEAAGLSQKIPLQSLTVNRLLGSLPALFACPEMARLRTLDCTGTKIGSRGATRLANSPHLAGLKSLNLAFAMVGIQGIQALARSPHLASLERLDLSGDGVRDGGAAALAGSPHLGRLTALNLHNASLGPDGLTALARSPHLNELRVLNLSTNRIGSDGIRALLGAPGLPRLTSLGLAQTNLEGFRIAELFESPRARSLTTLEMCYNQVPLDTWPAEAPPGPRRLRLRCPWVGKEVARALFASPFLGGCLELNLYSVDLCDEGVVALAGATAAEGLEGLDLTNNGITAEGVKSLASSPHLASLKRLSLASNPIGDDGLRALHQAPFLARLTHLDLRKCQLSADGLRELAGPPGLDSVVRLRVGLNEIVQPGTSTSQALRQRFGYRVVF